MARKRTQRLSKATGNEQALIAGQLTRLSSIDLEREPVLDGVLLEDVDLSGAEAAPVRLVEVALRRVSLAGTALRGIRLLDVHATAVDAANGTWPYAQMSRVTFESSALVGLDLANGQLRTTTFSECKLDLASFRMASVQDVVFRACSLRGADFYGADLRSVSFERCDLCEADFTTATLEMADLRSSALTDVRGVGSLKGAIVDASQLIDLAPSLAAELGIQVENLGAHD